MCRLARHRLNISPSYTPSSMVWEPPLPIINDIAPGHQGHLRVQELSRTEYHQLRLRSRPLPLLGVLERLRALSSRPRGSSPLGLRGLGLRRAPLGLRGLGLRRAPLGLRGLGLRRASYLSSLPPPLSSPRGRVSSSTRM